jgi:hypothetical protein
MLKFAFAYDPSVGRRRINTNAFSRKKIAFSLDRRMDPSKSDTVLLLILLRKATLPKYAFLHRDSAQLAAFVPFFRATSAALGPPSRPT